TYILKLKKRLSARNFFLAMASNHNLSLHVMFIRGFHTLLLEKALLKIKDVQPVYLLLYDWWDIKAFS
ncbi:hypothetical protein DRO66_09205, partial [Candidatus Bathyarchaeota archaeon]